MLSRFSFICLLFISSFNTYATSELINSALTRSDLGQGKIEYRIDNTKSMLAKSKSLARSTFFPTQLFNFTATAYIPGITCQELISQLNQIFIGGIVNNNFYISGLMTCISLPDNAGQSISVHGFFDPIDDLAVAVANQIISEVNGFNFYGTPILFEDSKAVVFQLMTNIGRVSPNKLFTRHQSFFAAAKFNSYYEAASNMLQYIRGGFDPSHEEIIIPMISYLFGAPSAETASRALREGNAIELLAMPTFLYKNSLNKFPGSLGFEVFSVVCNEAYPTCLPPRA